MASKSKKDKSQLSKRETEVLEAVSRGLSNQEIAAELIISVNTVRVHLRNIFAKLDVQSRTEASTKAMQAGLIALPPSEESAAGETSTSSDAAPNPVAASLTRWQYIFFAGAIVVSVLVFATPYFRLMVNKPVQNALVDIKEVEAAAPVPEVFDAWVDKAEMPTARSRLGVAAIGDDLYLIGGDRTSGVTGLVEAYNIKTHTWHEFVGKPTPVANIKAVVINDEIYVAGGCDGTDEAHAILEIFNPDKNEWRTGASLPQALCAYAAVTVDDELYLIGGWNGDEYVDSVYIYSPADDTWRESPVSYPIALGFAGAATVNGDILSRGGYNGEQEFADVYRLDAGEKAWQALPSMQSPRGGLGLAAMGDSLYAVGGGWTSMLSSNEVYSLAEETWRDFDAPYVNEWRNFGLIAIGHEMFAVGGWNGEHLNQIMTYKTGYRVFIPLSY